jgi:membrane protease YdiL (CAAX protease family)
LFLWVPVVHLLFCFLAIFLVVLFGNIMHLKGIGTFSLDPELLHVRFKELAVASGKTSVPPIPFSPLMLLIISIVSSVFLGGVVNVVFTLGEELGWRGFLYREMRSLGFWKANLLIGTIWGLWHAPIILQGHNYPDHPVAGVFMMVPFCISLGIIMSWIRLKTNSVLAPALLHGMLNAVGGGILLFCYDYVDLLGSVAGLTGIFACFLMVIIIAITDKKTIEMYGKDLSN